MDGRCSMQEDPLLYWGSIVGLDNIWWVLSNSSGIERPLSFSAALRGWFDVHLSSWVHGGPSSYRCTLAHAYACFTACRSLV